MLPKFFAGVLLGQKKFLTKPASAFKPAERGPAGWGIRVLCRNNYPAKQAIWAVVAGRQPAPDAMWLIRRSNPAAAPRLTSL